MSATVFFEGGGSTEATQSICRRGMRLYCEKLKPAGSRLRVVAAGSRKQTFDKFKRAAQTCSDDEEVALLVDSEAPVSSNAAAQHLHAQEGWDFTDPPSRKVFLMVQTMEAWFLADRSALAAYYDGGFSLNALPGSATNVELIRKADIGPALGKATQKTKKGGYHKIDHGSALLALINPATVEAASSHAAEFHKFLRSL